mmetsp:Transcript_160366/g.292843  ORF Transcript_160366/g.292843 Transcript_160366/m.292843 type:complete len:324 (-) Transcript_160366:2695-3666(-)
MGKLRKRPTPTLRLRTMRERVKRKLSAGSASVQQRRPQLRRSAPAEPDRRQRPQRDSSGRKRTARGDVEKKRRRDENVKMRTESVRSADGKMRINARKSANGKRRKRKKKGKERRRRNESANAMRSESASGRENGARRRRRRGTAIGAKRRTGIETGGDGMRMKTKGIGIDAMIGRRTGHGVMTIAETESPVMIEVGITVLLRGSEIGRMIINLSVDGRKRIEDAMKKRTDGGRDSENAMGSCVIDGGGKRRRDTRRLVHVSADTLRKSGNAFVKMRSGSASARWLNVSGVHRSGANKRRQPRHVLSQMVASPLVQAVVAHLK